jgi:alkylhydroperoxidase family enzyme
MTESNVVALRDVSFTERDILEICAIVTYYAYVNRIADGLGVQMETWLLDD